MGVPCNVAALNVQAFTALVACGVKPWTPRMTCTLATLPELPTTTSRTTAPEETLIAGYVAYDAAVISGGMYSALAPGPAGEIEIVWDEYPTPPGLNGLKTTLIGRTEGTAWPSNEAGVNPQLFTAA